MTACLAVGGLACSAGLSDARADEPAGPVSLPDSGIPSQWTLTEEELVASVRRYRAHFGLAAEGFLEEVTVKSPPDPLTMRDPARDIWGGVAAPFWALFHPTQAWRILLPVPPKKPAPDAPEQEP